MARFFILFVVVLVALFAAELTRPVQNAVILPWTEALVRLCRGLMTFFDSRVIASGKILQSSTNGFAISVEAGCNGIEAALILIAAHRGVGDLVHFTASFRNLTSGVILRKTSSMPG